MSRLALLILVSYENLRDMTKKMNKYEGKMKKYVGNMQKYEGNMKILCSPST